MAHFSWDRGPSKGPSYKSLTMLYVQCEKMGRIMVEEKFKWLLHNIGDYFPFKTSSQVWWAKEKEFVPLHVPKNWWRLCKFFLFFGLMLKFKPDLRAWTCSSGWACKYYKFKFRSKEWWATLRCSSSTIFRHISMGSNPIYNEGVVVVVWLSPYCSSLFHAISKRWGP